MLEDYIEPPIDLKKINYICKNLIGHPMFGYWNKGGWEIIKDFYKNVKINYRLNELEKEKIANVIEMLKLIQYNLKKSKLNSSNIQFSYLHFKFFISKNIIGINCKYSDNIFRPKLVNKVLKYLIYTNTLDELYDMLEKYHLTPK